MTQFRRAIALVMLFAGMAGPAAGQTRRAAGIRVGLWNADVASGQPFTRSPQIEGYFQRELDSHLALESSVSVWRVVAEVPGGTTKAYVAPLLTSLKYFPLTTPGDVIEPFVLAGVGFAIGVEDQAENAIGGTGTSVVTGFGLRGAAGVELSMTRGFALSLAGKYQFVRLGEAIASTESFSGLGFEGGITYRFP